MDNKIDLSPVRNAAQQFAALLPNMETPGGEMWRFFHFQTNDYCAMERAVRLACTRKNLSGQPLFISIGEFCGWFSEGAASKKKEDNYDFEGSEKLQEVLAEGYQIFVWQAFTKDVTGSTRDLKTGSTRDLKYSQLMLEFLRYCENGRAEQLLVREKQLDADRERQMKMASFVEDENTSDEQSEGCENDRISRNVFFISYGPFCPLPGLLRESLHVIIYPPLAIEDFAVLLEEYRQRGRAHRQRELGGRKMTEILLGTPDVCRDVEPGLPDASLSFKRQTLEWYANNMAGISELNVRRLLGGIISRGDMDYARTEVIEPIIVEHKNEVLRQHGRLEVLAARDIDVQAVYGLDTVLCWLEEHEKSIRLAKAADKRQLASKGILLVGIPGTGKSATAKLAAQVMKLPLVKLDMSRILGPYVGDSEKGMQEMLEDLKFAAPCVLWIDEVEKAMSGAGNSGGSNGGNKSGGSDVMGRMFGMLLTFMQENDKVVFSVTTANDISKLPPEFFRNGRFDQTFCVMMPEYNGCCKIMQGKLTSFMRSLGWLGPEEEAPLSYARELFDVCIGTKERPRFLTGADIEAHVKELFCKYGETKGSLPPVQSMTEQMHMVAGQMRTQASADSLVALKDIASRYLDMLQRGFVMAGSSKTPFVKGNLNLNPVRYYKYQENDKALPQDCILHPEPKKLQKNLNSDTPAEWYDARLFQCVVHEMNEQIIYNRDLTPDETRKSYYELMAALQRQ